MVKAKDPWDVIAAQAHDVEARLILGPNNSDAIAFGALIKGAGNTLDVHPVAPTDHALYLYSGGSTGDKPKLACLPHTAYTSVTEQMAIGEEGILQVRGAALADGYWRDPAATEKAFIEGGWFEPGDLVVMTNDFEDGRTRLIFKGRASGSFKVSGQRVSADEVEKCLTRHAAIQECAVFPFSDPRADGRTKPAAFIVVRSDHNVSDKDLQQYVLKTFPAAKYKCPQLFIRLNDFPRQHTEKIDRKRLRDLLADRVTKLG